jgi:hypothetical protein
LINAVYDIYDNIQLFDFLSKKLVNLIQNQQKNKKKMKKKKKILENNN